MAASSRGANAGDGAIHAERDRRFVELLAKIDGREGGQRLLDLGCGHGRAVAAVDLSACRAVVGVDRRGAALEVARGVTPAMALVNADGSSLPFAPGTFDVVVASTLFSSLLDPVVRTRVAGEVARVLRPGGVVAWYDLRRANPRNPAVRAVSTGDLAVLFPGWDLELRPATVAPPLARRLGPAVGLYPWLARLAVLNTHWLGLLRAPAAP